MSLAGAILELQELTERLRRECPWDREQTTRTIVPHTVEEAYEVADAALSRDDLLHVGVRGHAQAHEIARRRQLCRGPRGLRAGFRERFERGGPPGPQRHRVARLDDPPGHRRALAAEADEADPGLVHCDFSFSFIASSRVRIG